MNETATHRGSDRSGRGCPVDSILVAGMAIVAGLAVSIGLAGPAQAAAPATTGLAAPASDWQVAGRQGIVLVVIVPEGTGTDKAAYERQIARLCPQDRTCFVNFYGNSSGADPGVPLPEAIANEPTAMFRRSMKNQAELFRWSCRLNPGAAPECF